jgi:hypothetical protein
MKVKFIFTIFIIFIFFSIGLYIGYSSIPNPNIIITHANLQKHNNEVYILLKNRIDAQVPKIRQSWKRNEILEASYIIQEISIEHSIEYPYLIAMIEHESSLYKRARSKLNRNGTRDYGLTQQNSKYAKSRFERIFKDKFSKEKLFDFRISLKMMSERLRECAVYSTTDERILCYNSNSNIKYKRTKYLEQVKNKLKEFNINLKKYSDFI